MNITSVPGHEVAIEPLLRIQRRFPETLNDAAIHEVDRFDRRYGELADVGIDRVGVVKGKAGERIAIGSSGASSCLIISARDSTEEGDHVLGVLHLSHFAQPKEALKALAYAMIAEGARSVPLQLVGGVLSRSREPDDWLDQAEATLAAVDEVAAELAEELGRPLPMQVVSAKLGTCESRPGDHDDGADLLDSFHLPHSISAVTTTEGVFYGGEQVGRTFFQSNDDEGVPVHKLLSSGLGAG